VFERTSGPLDARGLGVAMHDDRYAELAAARYVDTSIPWVQLRTRRWYVRDDAAGPMGRELWPQPFPFRTYNWGALWRELRRRVPDDVEMRVGDPVREVVAEPDGPGVLVTAGPPPDGTAQDGTALDGTTPGSPAPAERFDLVVGADGYRSVVRAAAFGDVRPAYAGYTAWRGAFPVERLAAAGLWPEEECAYVVFPGGHLITYRIPDTAGAGQHVNWVVYATPPPGHAPAPESPLSLPPGTAPQALRDHLAYIAAELLPPFWGDLVRLTTPQELFLQPLYDFTAARYTAPGTVLTGDAATVARPHTGAGAVKALQDASALEAALAGTPDLAAALAAYDAGRSPVGRAMVSLGRRLGRVLVERTPDWQAMDGAGLAEWWRSMDTTGTFGGARLTAGHDTRQGNDPGDPGD
jgi:2-polyprenyl-6-methoxyphenol hydroxylase-like FAD-dependent oxidoreductase